MILKRLILDNYRNYASLDLELNSGLEVISGDNAQGKTNLLESIYYLGTLRSFRTRCEAELVGWGSSSAGIKALFLRQDGQECELEVRWALNPKGGWERRVKRNGVALKNAAEFLRLVPIALFVPQDLALVQGGPDLRRRYLDILLCKSSPTYIYDLLRYQQVLKQRNEWWRRRGFSRRWYEVEVWDEQLANLAIRLVTERRRALGKLGNLIRAVFNSLSAEPLDLGISYRSTAGETTGQVIQALQARREEELRRHYTVLGPHRDDVVFTVQGRGFKQCASQGQHRSLALALRLAEARYLGEASANPAVVLLDDCFSELDAGRCRRLFDCLGDIGQVIVTSVSCLDYRGATRVTEYAVKRGNIVRLGEGGAYNGS